jgi:carbon-monoxide dehydrogenase medium subunit
MTRFARPTDVDAVIAELQPERTVLIAGGVSLIPELKDHSARPEGFVSLAHIATLRGVTVDPDTVRIGACTTHAAIAGDRELRVLLPEVGRVFGNIGHPRVRQWGTVGGNVATRDARHDGPTLLTALGATANVVDTSGERTVDVSNLAVGIPRTSVVTEFHLPRLSARQGIGFEKRCWYGGDFALVNAAAFVEVRDRLMVIKSAAVGGMAVRGVHLADTSSGEFDVDDIAALKAYTGKVAANLPTADDMHGGSSYKTAVAAVTLRRAIDRAVQDAMKTRTGG